MLKLHQRDAVPMQTGTTLLDYSIHPEPNPLQASAEGATDVATLTLIVSNGSGSIVTCTSITVSILVGTYAKDLVASASGITTEKPDDWSIAQSGGTFTLTPNTQEAGQIGPDGVTFTFGDVTINSEVGTTSVTIDELASSPSNPLQDRPGTIPLAKFPPQFTLSDLSVDPTEVGSGGSVTLYWEGSPTGAYSLKFNPGSCAQNIPVGNKGPYPAADLTNDPVVVFTLVVTYMDEAQDQPVIAQKTAFVTVDPPPPAVTSFNATVHDQQASFTWSSQNALSCSMSAWPNLLNQSGTLGPLAIDRMRFSMVANASKLSSAPANADLAFSIVTQLTVVPSPCQAWRFHRSSDGSMLVVVANSEPDLVVAVVDTEPLTVRNSLAIPSSDVYGSVTALSPDGKSLLINAFLKNVSSALATLLIPAIVLDLVEIDPPNFDPDTAAFSPDGQKLFVTYSQPPFPTRVLNTATLQQETSFNLPSFGPCAVSPDGTRFYVAGDKAFIIADAASGTILGQPALGSEISNGLAMNAPGTLVFVNGGNGIVSVVDTAAMQVIQQIPTGSAGAGKSTANGIAIGPSGGEVYVADPASNFVIAIDATTFSVIGKIALPESPVDLAFGTGSIMQLYVLGLSGTIYLLEVTGPV